ncbi:LysM peptidoglycan-binding domain-containing protein [Halofilum ochraceum]|uniref:LysM peptidoglycan-binding domain-containing protein n=1 Tax=Halofilum ochraceum TaxID=1611323 RepID=UPI001C310CEA|nr:LysM domain-containing protein [Halofilum ochraceum]
MTDRPSIDALRTALIALALALIAGCASQKPEPTDEPAAEPAQSEPEPALKTEPKVTREDVKPSHPVRYTVKRGDTLWDIAAMFLRDPWVWPEIWSVNPQIENPHLIYPGDIITLAFRDGEPRLIVERPGMPEGGDGYEKLEPQVRERSLDEAIPSIPADAIRQFLNRPRVVTAEELERAPYIVGNYEGRLISGEGNDVFARGFEGSEPDADRYNVYRPGDPLREPDTGEILGYEALYVGKAAVRQGGDPARLHLTESTREILRGDRLMPADRQFARGEYIPRLPDERVDAQIIQLFDAISQVATNQVVVLNHGETDGAEVADVLAVMQSGGTVQDPYASAEGTETVELPPQRVGTLMIFRTFERVSYGLILDATQSIRLNDTATNP